MAEKTIGLIAAMPDEIRPLLRRIGKVHREKIDGFNLYRFSTGSGEAALIESGIGAARAAEATGILIEATSPGKIVNFGFCGGVVTGPAVGDIIMADRLLFFQGGVCSGQSGLSAPLSAELARKLAESCEGRGFRIHHGTFITAVEIVAKQSLARFLPAGTTNPVLEMETAAVARISADRGIPLVAVRAVSDPADEELGFTIDEFTDRDMNISAWKVLRTLAGRPRIIPQLIRLARNADLAGKNLAVAVNALLEKIQ